MPQSGKHRELNTLDQIADLMDSRFVIPGTGIRFGLDSIAGLVPGIGDTATALVGTYLIYRAARLGAPNALLARMALNIGIDWAAGSVPILGDIFDVYYKAHRRNMALLKDHLGNQADAPAFDNLTSNAGGRASV